MKSTCFRSHPFCCCGSDLFSYPQLASQSLPTWQQTVLLSPILLCRLPGQPGPSNPSEEVFLAFGRVFSGVLRDQQEVHVLSAAYHPGMPAQHRQVLTVGRNPKPALPNMLP